MKLAMSLTLDGLVRALRWKAHDLAEALEEAYFDDRDTPSMNRQARYRTVVAQAKGDGDDFSRG